MSKRPDIFAKLSKAPTADYLTAATASVLPDPTGGIDRIPVDLLRPSPFQPPGRASTAAMQAVRDAAAFAGSFAALVGSSDDAEANERGRVAFSKLDKQEARPLAELAADLAARLQDGREDPIEVPLDVRQTSDGLELITGHRRWAAASLAGVPTAPVRNRGALDDAATAELVFRNNRLRADFSPWQEARALAVLRDTRRALNPADRRMGSTRDLARLMGYSVGRATELLQMADAFPDTVTQALGDGSDTAGHEHLARLSYAALRKLIGVKDAGERFATARELIAPTKKPERPRVTGDPPAAVDGVYAVAKRRGDGYSLTVFRPADKLAPEGARALLAFYEAQAKALRAVLQDGER